MEIGGRIVIDNDGFLNEIAEAALYPHTEFGKQFLKKRTKDIIKAISKNKNIFYEEAATMLLTYILDYNKHIERMEIPNDDFEK